MFMKIREYTRFACDFETTVYDGQDTTLVWSAAFAELFKNDVHVLGSIDDFFKYFFVCFNGCFSVNLGSSSI